MDIVIDYDNDIHHYCRVKNTEDLWGKFRKKPTELRKFDTERRRNIAIALHRLALDIEAGLKEQER